MSGRCTNPSCEGGGYRSARRVCCRKCRPLLPRSIRAAERAHRLHPDRQGGDDGWRDLLIVAAEFFESRDAYRGKAPRDRRTA